MTGQSIMLSFRCPINNEPTCRGENVLEAKLAFFTPSERERETYR
jgi:hypothetical protein